MQNGKPVAHQPNPASVGMVGWYDPAQLVRTAIDVVFSTTLGKHADNRRSQALGTTLSSFIEYSDASYLAEDGNFWLDYVADCGDGGNSTYAVAAAVSADSCEGLTGGRILVFGGDEVYPGASRLEYDRRLLVPYEVATQTPHQPQREVLALPGNHDWYDSLSAFTGLFLSGENFAGWKTRQSRSYFAAKLPFDWWLLGVDVQLTHDIDLAQLKYFLKAADGWMGPADRVILCSPEPFWISAELDRDRDQRVTETNLQKLIAALGEKLHLTVAGDLHHYRRHSAPGHRHRITCGCGGAFTHPTHDDIKEELSAGYRHEVSVPSSSQSRRLTRNNLGFLFRNPKFGILTGLLYLMIAWGLGTHMGESFAAGVAIEEISALPITEPLRIAKAALHAAIINQVSMGFILALFLGFVLFTDSRFQKFRWIGGITHAATHLLGATFAYWLATRLCIHYLGMQPKSILQYLSAGSLILPLGWIIGSFIMGLYLWGALNLFGQHSNEAFSALRIQDWKGFLRMKVSPDGELTVHFIGIRRVPRKWKRNQAATGPLWLPADGGGKCEVIDEVVIPALDA